MAQRLRIGARLTPGVKWILIGVSSVFAVWLFGGPQMREFFARELVLTARGAIEERRLWQLLVAPLINVNGITLLFDGLMLWLFVPALERWWGTQRFLKFFAATSFTAAVASALVGLMTHPDLPASGVSPFIYASIAAFGVLYAEQQVALFGVIQMKGKSLAIGMTVVIVLVTVLDRNWVRGSGTLAAMALAWLITSGFAPNLMMLKLRRWWLKRRYKVLDGGKGKDKQKYIN
jgi:membrane associated rhomboid family serine protease